MIVLEFRQSETLHRVARTFEHSNLPFKSEVSDVDFRPHRVWLFLEDVQSPGQQRALAQARLAEKEDLARRGSRMTPNLPDPL